MFNKFKLLACFLEIHVYAFVSKSAESCWQGFCAFPINFLNMSSAK